MTPKLSKQHIVEHIDLPDVHKVSMHTKYETPRISTAYSEYMHLYAYAYDGFATKKCGIYVRLQPRSIVRRSPHRVKCGKKGDEGKIVPSRSRIYCFKLQFRTFRFGRVWFFVWLNFLLHSVLFHRFCSKFLFSSLYWMAFKTPNNNHIRCYTQYSRSRTIMCVDSFHQLAQCAAPIVVWKFCNKKHGTTTKSRTEILCIWANDACWVTTC